MVTVKFRRGVLIPLAVFTLVLVVLFVAGPKSSKMASRLEYLGIPGHLDLESYDDEGETISGHLAQYLSSFGGFDAKSGAGGSNQEKQNTKPSSQHDTNLDVFMVPLKSYPKVTAPSKNTVGSDFSFRLYSHNIKNGAYHHLVKGEVPWEYRKSHVVSSIKAHTPANSIIALQEPVKFQLDEVLQALNRYSGQETPEWTAYGGGRVDGANEGEFVPIIIRDAEWEVLFHDTFWLNEKDERSSYTGWDGKYPRISTYVTLKHRQTGNHINVFNTHFDHKGTVARTESATMLLEKMETLNEWPSFLLGDLNAVPNDGSYKKLSQVYADTHTLVNSENRYGHHEWTVTGFSGQLKADAKRIDYIFSPAYVRKEWDSVCGDSERPFDLRLKGYGLMHSKFGGIYMSDHRPLVADFQFHKC